MVPLPKREKAKQIGESRSLAVRRLLSLEQTLHARRQFDEFDQVIKEYFHLGHAELVPLEDLTSPLMRYAIYPCMLCIKSLVLPQKYVLYLMPP